VIGKLWRNKIKTHSFDELLSVVPDNASREPDLAEADVFVHLLYVFGIEWTPSATHLEQQHTKGPEINQFRIAVVV
jgi:hypothetical protein